MFRSPSSSSLLLLFLLCRAAGSEAECSESFCTGKDNFVINANDTVRDGGILVATETRVTDSDCKDLCQQDSRCNLALLEPRDTEADTRTCVLFNCVYKNRFVCLFVGEAGYQIFVKKPVFQRYLQGPGKLAPPIANAGRDVIVQPGETVTLNGTESLVMHDAHITDYHWEQQSGSSDVVMEKTDLPDQLRLTNLKSGSYNFQLTVTDSSGQSNKDQVSVLVLNAETSSLYCMAPVKVGPCRAAFTRWRYNVTKGYCERFTFGGCKANENNYLFEHECMSACNGVTVSSQRSITLPVAKECGATCRPDQLTCDDCCLDRSLECDGVQHCNDGSDETNCSTLRNTLSQLLNISVTESKVHCTEPPYTGPCRASHTRWYYNPLEKKCKKFTYGGCYENGNNFDDEDLCGTTCEGVTERNLFSRGMFERFTSGDITDPDAEKLSKTDNVTLVVVLLVAILAGLAVVGYCYLKKRKERADTSTTRPAHSPLPEEDTLVYNSTTKPL